MTIPFYKLQVAGNGFILVGQETEGLTADRYPLAARRLCDRRFGVGATGALFLGKDGSLRAFNAQGQASQEADDALLCAARYAFDTGRIAGKSIEFMTARGKKTLDILGAHEFRLNVGSPFALLGGRVITSESDKLVELLEHDGIKTACSAVHIHDDVVVAYPQSLGTLNYAGYAALVQRAFPDRNVIPAIARAITGDTILVKANARSESGACACAAAALVAGVCGGSTEREAVVMFDPAGPEAQPDSVIAKDRDNSRRLAISWDTEANELQVIGSGGYLFEGKFDLLAE